MLFGVKKQNYKLFTLDNYLDLRILIIVSSYQSRRSFKSNDENFQTFLSQSQGLYPKVSPTVQNSLIRFVRLNLNLNSVVHDRCPMISYLPTVAIGILSLKITVNGNTNDRPSTCKCKDKFLIPYFRMMEIVSLPICPSYFRVNK